MNNIIEWLAIVIIVFLAAVTELPLFQSYQGYVPIYNTLYSYPNIPSSLSNIKLLSITLGPIYFVLMFNIFVLKITTYWQYQKELGALRDIEIEKNRNNKPNKLKVLNRLLNNKYCAKEVISHFISLTKAVLFALSLSHLITFGLQIYIVAPPPFYNNSTQYSVNSFPSKSASNSMSTNYLLFLCMMHSFRTIQRKYCEHRYNGNILRFSAINSHCFNGNVYFCSNIWYLFRHIKIFAVFLISTPLLFTFYIGLIQIIEYTHFTLDVMAGFSVGIFCAMLSFNTFKDELLFERTIPTLTEMMRIQSVQQRSPSSSISSDVSAGKRIINVAKKSKFPDIGIDMLYTDADMNQYTNIFGSNVKDYNLRDLEEIALQIGTKYVSTKRSRSIETDDDGVDVEEETESEESVESTETTTRSPSTDVESRMSAVTKRKHTLLYNHRKNIKLRLAPPINIGSKLSQLSPLSLNFDRHQRNITPVDGTQSIGSYQEGYME